MQEILSEALLHLEEALAPYKDSDITVRIIGEFSAGKSRLIKELFKDIVPKQLLPVSRRARETMVPLEITYGEGISLWEIKRPQDYAEVEFVKKWEDFPQRGEFVLSGDDLNTHRLRLTVPQKELVINDNPLDDEEKGTLRIFLIDTPGWNSGELEASLHTLTGEKVIASVYVVQANRIDSKSNAEELKIVLEEIYDKATFAGRENLMVYVTHWSDDEDKTGGWRKEFEERTKTIADEALFDEAIIQFEYLDFDRMTPVELVDFREKFWKNLYRGFETAGHDIISFADTIEKWDLLPQLKTIATRIKQGSEILRDFKKGDKYIPGWNMTRLKAYPQKEWGNLLWKEFPLRTKIDNGLLEGMNELELASDHPLAQWWNKIFLPLIKDGLKEVENLIREANHTLKRLDGTVHDMNRFLKDNLDFLHEETRQKFLRTQSLFPPSLEKIIMNDGKLAGIVATLISITICQSEIQEAINQLVTHLSDKP